MTKQNNKVLKGAAAGLIGGVVAAAVMSGFQALVQPLMEDENKSKKKEKKKNDDPATVKAAEAISEYAFDHKLTDDEKGPAGEAIHYAMGAASGLIYGVAAEIAPVSSIGGGLPFGAAVWVIADDVAVPALGFAKPATEYPLKTHVYALSSHLVYGLTTDLVRRALLKVL